MTIDIRVNLDPYDEIVSRLHDITDSLDGIYERLSGIEALQVATAIAEQQQTELIGEAMSDISAAIDADAAAIAEQTTVVDSVVTMLTSQADQIDAILAQLEATGVTPEQLTALSDFAGAVRSNTTRLADAVAAGTAADGETPPTEPTPGEPV